MLAIKIALFLIQFYFLVTATLKQQVALIKGILMCVCFFNCFVVAGALSFT